MLTHGTLVGMSCCNGTLVYILPFILGAVSIYFLKSELLFYCSQIFMMLRVKICFILQYFPFCPVVIEKIMGMYCICRKSDCNYFKYTFLFFTSDCEIMDERFF